MPGTPHIPPVTKEAQKKKKKDFPCLSLLWETGPCQLMIIVPSLLALRHNGHNIFFNAKAAHFCFFVKLVPVAHESKCYLLPHPVELIGLHFKKKEKAFV